MKNEDLIEKENNELNYQIFLDKKFNGSFSAAVVIRNCIARKDGGNGAAVRTIERGTLIQVWKHFSEVSFSIIHEDILKVDSDCLICKFNDVALIPNKLLGCLLPLSPDVRIHVAKDLSSAESLANITVNSNVEILGPSKELIGYGIVVFFDIIPGRKLGLYYGVSLVGSEETRTEIARKISLVNVDLPDRCDILITAEYLRPTSKTLEEMSASRTLLTLQLDDKCPRLPKSASHQSLREEGIVRRQTSRSLDLSIPTTKILNKDVDIPSPNTKIPNTNLDASTIRLRQSSRSLDLPQNTCKRLARGRTSASLDSDSTSSKSVKEDFAFGQIDCPVVEGVIPPISLDLDELCGKNRGIQGHHNSCYLDATLFAMFAFTSVFDSLLYRPSFKDDIPQYNEVQRVLRDEIVNPLRRNLYVRADRVMTLRKLLEKLSSVTGLTSEEKDPEEFLNSLLAQILKAEPFLQLSSGQEAFHYQLFVEKDERLAVPTVQQLLEQSFIASDIKLKKLPPCLIIQMPRFGKSFKMYSRILPPTVLDVTDVIENSPRQCTVCGKLAELECRECFVAGMEGWSFCARCLDKVHCHPSRSRHTPRRLIIPTEFRELQEHCDVPRLQMHLFAVVCIETSHYVSFLNTDQGWVFFDSMADRKGEQNGYNIPEIVSCPELAFWFTKKGAQALSDMRDERQLPELAKRLLCDAYMCMYQSQSIMMYR